MFHILTSSRAKRGDRKILRLISRFASCNDGVVNNRAFTLAEVLITLLIIGVVASMVIPNIINDSQNAEAVTRAKKTVAELSHAFNLVKQDNGGVLTGNIFIGGQDSSGARNIMNVLVQYISLTKNCDTGVGCWAYPTVFLNNVAWVSSLDNRGDLAKAILSDGTIIYVGDLTGDCSVELGTFPFNQICGWGGFDINGSKGPNKIGRDTFPFVITSIGLSIPYYPAYNPFYPATNTENRCDASRLGYQCLSRILKEGAINY